LRHEVFAGQTGRHHAAIDTRKTQSSLIAVATSFETWAIAQMARIPPGI
jgi:hypothetical protein